jgi:hypothetical protein
MALASGVSKQVVLAEQTVDLATAALTGAADAEYLRRVSSDLSLTRDSFESNEIRSDRQVSDFRLGTKRVAGTLQGELSTGSYEALIGAALRRNFAAPAVSFTAQAADELTSASSGDERTFTRAGGAGTDFLALGFKVGHVIRTGSTGTTCENFNYRVVNVTTTAITVQGTSGGDFASDADATLTVVGHVSYIPTTAHTSKQFTIEHHFSDIDYTELFTGCRIGFWAVDAPASGLVTTSFGITGVDMTQYTAGSAPYFSSPAAAGTGGALASVTGAIRWNDGTTTTDLALITSINFTLELGLSADPVVGQNTVPEIFFGRSRISGSLTAYLQDSGLAASFINETDVELHLIFETASGATPENFFSIYIPRVRLTSNSMGDGEQGIIQSFDFVGLLQNNTGSAYQPTSLMVQDSTLT